MSQHDPPTDEVDGAAIRRLRKRSGKSMKQLAEQGGISRRYLNHLEIGTRRHASPGVVAALHKALRVERSEILANPDGDHSEKR